MYKIALPDFQLSNFFRELIKSKHNNVNNKFFRTRLLAAESVLISNEKIYLEKALSGELYKMEEHEHIELCGVEEINEIFGSDESVINITKHQMKELFTADIEKKISSDEMKDLFSTEVEMNISTEEMSKLYDQDLVGKKSREELTTGRKIYNQILSTAEFDLCPYCGDRTVKTVDHYLPKKKFPSYSITPMNLIPACRDCNTDKLDEFKNEQLSMLINPYFDEFENVKWLKAKVIENVFPITFKFHVNNSSSDDEVLINRFKNQFTLLSLGSLYAGNAGREVRGRYQSIVKNYEAGGVDAVIFLFEEAVETYKVENENSWKTCMFEALLESEWFRKEGVHKFKEHYFRR